MKNTIPNSISQNIKKYRLLNKLTQEQLSLVEKFITDILPYTR